MSDVGKLMIIADDYGVYEDDFRVGAYPYNVDILPGRGISRIVMQISEPDSNDVVRILYPVTGGTGMIESWCLRPA